MWATGPQRAGLLLLQPLARAGRTGEGTAAGALEGAVAGYRAQRLALRPTEDQRAVSGPAAGQAVAPQAGSVLGHQRHVTACSARLGRQLGVGTPGAAHAVEAMADAHIAAVDVKPIAAPAQRQQFAQPQARTESERNQGSAVTASPPSRARTREAWRSPASTSGARWAFGAMRGLTAGAPSVGGHANAASAPMASVRARRSTRSRRRCSRRRGRRSAGERRRHSQRSRGTARKGARLRAPLP